MTFDYRSESNLATLHPEARTAARAFLQQAIERMRPLGIEVKIISGTRTYAEQDALYAQGRTKPGPVVTNARGGYSKHNFGIAFDIGLFKSGRYLDQSPYYRELGAIGIAQGLVWGGNWKNFKDEPHYELPTGLTLAQMRDRVAKGLSVV